MKKFLKVFMGVGAVLVAGVSSAMAALDAATVTAITTDVASTSTDLGTIFASVIGVITVVFLMRKVYKLVSRS